MPQKWVI